jgi:peroxiredoxin
MHLARIIGLSATLLALVGCGPRPHVQDWPDRTPQQRGMLDGYQPVGAWTTYHKDGSLASTGTFVAGRQEGRWTYGHPGGAPAGVGHWKAGVQHGWWQVTAADGAVTSAGLMWDGRRAGPWIDAGAARVYGPAAVIGADTIAWQAPGQASVSWLLGGGIADVDALWVGTDGTWNDRLTDARSRAAIASLLPNAAAPPAAGPATVAEIAPVTAEVPLTPIPPLIRYNAIVRAIAGNFRSGFSGDIDKAAQAPTAGGPMPKAGGDPIGAKLVGTTLPQTRFLSSSGAVINLAAPERTTAVTILRGFSGSVCLYCASQTAALADAAPAFTAAGIDQLIIYPGPAETIPGFVDAVQQLRADPPPIPVALDVNLLLTNALGIADDLAKPTALILDRQGRIAWSYVGTSMSDRPSAAEILAAARAVP